MLVVCGWGHPQSNKYMSDIRQAVTKRRTFAIISHPDAGKTTLTERLLLYSGMIRTAGMVRARKGAKNASSDWMALEQERGISITASAMQFNYKNSFFNVLDTPGHQDFSEDTYRTLTAADFAVMVLDAAKGVETQTRKLFAVCRMRGIPVMTFINKMDLPGRDPFELLSEVEEVLGIQSSPMNWPIGEGQTFCGVIDLRDSMCQLFRKRAAGGALTAERITVPINEALATGIPSEPVFKNTLEQLELIQGAGNPFSEEKFLAGEITPVFFGSALTNFGLEPFFDCFETLAPCPAPRKAFLKDGSEVFIDPMTEKFSAYVFKIQANMDPRHRDSMAFLRINSGVFERDMVVHHSRMKKEVRLSRPHSMLAGDRETVDAAYPGDIVGTINPGVFRIGDTVSLRGDMTFEPLPQFPPEVVAQIRPKDVGKRKAFDKGMEQLSEEGAIQLLKSRENPLSEPFIAAVGRLQFEVLQYRLRQEYNVETILDVTQHECGAWLEGDPDAFKKPSSALLTTDVNGKTVALFRSPWERDYAMQQNPNHKLAQFGS
jgi:peptide chain release factor 3